MNKVQSGLWVGSSVLLSLGGIAAFIYLFGREFNIYWFILSPVILAIYQIPAVYVIWLWKKKRSRIKPPGLSELKKEKTPESAPADDTHS